MIFNAFVDLFVGLLTGFMSLLPSLPSFPDTAIAGVSSVFLFLSSSAGFVSWLFSPPLLISCLSIAVGIMLFDPIYNGILWVIHKIPGASIR